MKRISERLYNGIIKENPTFVLTLGMCPTLAVTTSAINGLGMGLTTCAVLALSNLFISLLRKVIPDKVRIPAFIVIVASFVTMVQLLLEAYLPALNQSLGIYIPLIVVNCIILGRAESYAYKNPPIPSLFDGIGMGLGFTGALTILGIFREFIGSGTFFGNRVFPEEYGITIFVLAPGAFFVLAVLVAVQNYIKAKMEAKGKDTSKIGSGCGKNCMGCPEATGCSKADKDAVKAESKEELSEDKAEVKESEKDPEAKQEPEEKPEPEKEPEPVREAEPEAEAEKEPEAENESASDDSSETSDDKPEDNKPAQANKPSGNNNKKKNKGKRRK
ncbi:MAG: electron transport complex subunit E [Lachnospiraceae bacterium]|nr:electron transport complex subunit E [Lachnospiraceae bacterium]